MQPRKISIYSGRSFKESKAAHQSTPLAQCGWRILLLSATIVILWCTIYGRWELSIPVSIDHDSGYLLAMMRLAQKGDLGLFGHIKTESLGAPFTGSLNDYPQNERAILWIGGIMARFLGLYKAANLMVIGLHLLAGISFYCAARLWKICIPVAWTLALVYAFSHQTVRSLPHLGVGYFGLLPLQLYTCWYIAIAPRLSWKSHRFKISLVIGLLSGFLSIYWLVLFIQIYGASLIYRLSKIKSNIAWALVPLVLTLTVASTLLSSFVVYQIQNGHNPKAIIRRYRDTEFYSLKPIDLFIPRTGQGFGVIDSLYRRYVDGRAIILGESGTAYIGLISILGLLLLFQNQYSVKYEERASRYPLL